MRPMFLRPTLLAIALGPASVHAGAPAPLFDPATVDWAPIGKETARLLADYVQIETVNPPGNELLGAMLLAGWLAQWGIESTVHEYAPGRANLWARVHGSTNAPPICLLSHIDVVPAEAERWSSPPFPGGSTTRGTSGAGVR